MRIRRKTIEIRKPFFGAGTTYNWTKDGYDIAGIGIRAEYGKQFDSFDIILGKETYRVSTEKIREFVRKYNSYHLIENYNVRLVVFSKSIMRNITKKLEKEKVKEDTYKKQLGQEYNY